jgi:hypothetical protein
VVQYRLCKCPPPVPTLSRIKPYQRIGPGPRHVYPFRNKTSFYGEELLASRPTPKPDGCPRLLIQYIRSYRPYGWPFLHLEPEDGLAIPWWQGPTYHGLTWLVLCRWMGPGVSVKDRMELLSSEASFTQWFTHTVPAYDFRIEVFDVLCPIHVCMREHWCGCGSAVRGITCRNVVTLILVLQFSRCGCDTVVAPLLVLCSDILYAWYVE